MVGDSIILLFFKNKRHGPAISAGLPKPRSVARSTTTQDTEGFWNDATSTYVNLALMQLLST